MRDLFRREVNGARGQPNLMPWGDRLNPWLSLQASPGQRHALNFPHVMPAAQHEIDFPEQFRILLKKRRQQGMPA
jgi:hypothetical protein